MTGSTTSNPFKSFLQDLFLGADVRTDGARPWDILVHDDRFYRRVIKEHTIGLGESYMDGWWDCEHLDQFFHHLLVNKVQDKAPRNFSIIAQHLLSRVVNLQSKLHLKKDIAVSYDQGIDLYMSFLDSHNQYSCGYFMDTDDLEEAQQRKMDLICRKLYLKPGDRVLDIGCGWGGLSRFMAEKRGCKVTGISISRQQVEFGRNFCKGLDVEILEVDYRDLAQPSYEGAFDKIVSVGMIEHIGYKNYGAFMRIVNHCLKKDGLFLLHTIGSNDSITSTDSNFWLTKYIFPDSMPPSITQLANAAEKIFLMEDLHNFGQFYDLTLMAWAKNFDKNWVRLRSQYDERFRRMWRYYLLQCAGGFRARHNQLYQMVFTKYRSKGNYCSVR